MGISKDANNQALTIHSSCVTTVPIRPADVVSTVGQLQVLPQGMLLTLTDWPIDDALKGVRLPTIRYAPAAVNSHTR